MSSDNNRTKLIYYNVTRNDVCEKTKGKSEVFKIHCFLWGSKAYNTKAYNTKRNTNLQKIKLFFTEIQKLAVGK